MKIIHEYSKRLLAKGFDVLLYYPFAYYNLNTGKNEYSFNPKRIYWAQQNFFNGKENEKSLKGIKIKGVPLINDYFIRDADYVFATTWPTSYDVSMLRKSKGIKYYLIQGIETWNSNIDLVNQSYELDLNRIAICGYLSDALFKKYGVKSEVILNGIDFEVYKDTINKDYNYAGKTICYIDYQLEKKNTASVMKAVTEIKKEHPEVKVKAFGIKKFNNHPDFVEFIENPSQNEIVRIYNESHIFIFASFEEGFGLPPAEAMACKTSVVTSPVGAIPEFSKNNESAIFINPFEVSSIVSGINLLLSDNDFNKRISECGYETVRNTLNWDVSVNKLIGLLS